MKKVLAVLMVTALACSSVAAIAAEKAMSAPPDAVAAQKNAKKAETKPVKKLPDQKAQATREKKKPSR